MKDFPSFMSSTLSLAFIACILSVLAMIFLHVEPSEKLLSVITAVVGAYIGSRIPTTEKPQELQEPEVEVKSKSDTINQQP